MITIHCTQCQTPLEIDDAFVGGVCRCVHCGAIQTVPKPARRPAAPVPDPNLVAQNKAAKTLYQRAPRSDTRPGSGISRLADAVPSSSTLTGAGHTANRVEALLSQDADHSPAHDNTRHLHLWLYGLGGMIVVLTVLVIWLLIRSSHSAAPFLDAQSPSTVDAEHGAASSAAIKPDQVLRIPDISKPGLDSVGSLKPNKPKLITPPADKLARGNEPRFYGLRIDAPTVAFVLDRNGSMKDSVYDELRQNLYRSLGTLKASQRFRVVMIGRKDDPFIWPQTGYVTASADNISSCKEAVELQPLVPDRELSPADAFNAAWADGTRLVVFATAKDGYDDPAATNWLKDRARSSSTQVYGFNLNGFNRTSRALKKLAESTHGLYRELSADDARAYAQGKK